MTRDELADVAQKLGTPVDFDGLVKAGVLKRKGKYTFEVLDMKRLPEYASRQVHTMKASSGKPPVLTFNRSNKQAQKTYESLTGKKFKPVK